MAAVALGLLVQLTVRDSRYCVTFCMGQLLHSCPKTVKKLHQALLGRPDITNTNVIEFFPKSGAVYANIKAETIIQFKVLLLILNAQNLRPFPFLIDSLQCKQDERHC